MNQDFSRPWEKSAGYGVSKCSFTAAVPERWSRQFEKTGVGGVNAPATLGGMQMNGKWGIARQDKSAALEIKAEVLVGLTS